MEVTVRNTFVHVALPEIADGEVDGCQELQGGRSDAQVRRAATMPFMWVSDTSSDSEEDGKGDHQENGDFASEGEDVDSSPQPSIFRIKTHDAFEVSFADEEEASLELLRIKTHDAFEVSFADEEEPSTEHVNAKAFVENLADWSQPRLMRTRPHDTQDVVAVSKRPSFMGVRTQDSFASPVMPKGELAQFFHAGDHMPSVAPPPFVSDGVPHLASSLELGQPTAASNHCAPWARVGKEARGAENGQGEGMQPELARAARGKATSNKPKPARTTIMLRNLPNNYTRTMLLDLLGTAGFAGEYDFLYLPMDFRTHAALGYAFVNLVGPAEAERFQQYFNGFSKWSLPSSKVCSASWSDHQGLDAHVARYRNSPLMHETVPDAYRPIMFADGVRISFPPATKKIKPPRQGTERLLV